jgi:hypothetical protein
MLDSEHMHTWHTERVSQGQLQMTTCEHAARTVTLMHVVRPDRPVDRRNCRCDHRYTGCIIGCQLEIADTVQELDRHLLMCVHVLTAHAVCLDEIGQMMHFSTQTALAGITRAARRSQRLAGHMA